MLFYNDKKLQYGGTKKCGLVFCVEAVIGVYGKYLSQFFISSLCTCYEVQTGSHAKNELTETLNK